MNPNTEAALKYFLSKDPHECIFHTRCEKLYFKSKHILPYKDHIQSGGDLSSIIDKIREDLYDPIKEEAIKDMIICTAMEPEFLKYVSTKHHDRVTSEAVKQNELALEYASAELQGDREIVLEAVKQNADAFVLVGKEFQSDPEIIRASYSSSPKAFEYTKGIYACDPIFICECLYKDARGVLYLNRMKDKELFNRFSPDLRRRIDYLSSGFFEECDYRDIHIVFDDWKTNSWGNNHIEFIEETNKRVLIELQALGNSYKQLQIIKTQRFVRVGVTVASYLSVKEAVLAGT